MKNFSAIALLFGANTVSGIAQGISMIAIPWYFTRQGETGLFGIIYWAITFSALFWAPTAGTFVDKYNRKYIFLVVGLISGLIVGSIALVGYGQGHVPLGLVALVFATTFFNYNLHYPTLYAFLQEITEPRQYGTITSAVEIQGQAATALSGASAALLLEGFRSGPRTILGIPFNIPFSVEPWEMHEIFALDAGTYFVAALLVVMIRYTPVIKRQEEAGKIWARLKTGFLYLKDQPYIFLFGVASFSIFVTVLMVTFYLAAIYVNNHLGLGGDVFAISEVAYALGAIFAGFTIRRIFRKRTMVSSIIIMTVTTAILFIVMALTKQEYLFYLMLLVLGITNAGTRIQRVTYLFNHIPNQVYGRANSIFGLSNILWRVLFLALFSLPFFHQNNHVIYGLLIMSAFLLIASAVMALFYRHLVNPALGQPKKTAT